MVIHALDRTGRRCVLATTADAGYWYWDEAMAAPEPYPVEVVAP
jgi:hypothetical protein